MQVIENILINYPQWDEIPEEDSYLDYLGPQLQYMLAENPFLRQLMQRTEIILERNIKKSPREQKKFWLEKFLEELKFIRNIYIKQI